MEQMTIFQFLKEEKKEIPEIFKAGQIVYGVVLGEVEEHRIISLFIVFGIYRNYGTQKGVILNEEIGERVFDNIEMAKSLARENLKECQYVDIERIDNLKKWQYVRDCDDYKMIAMLGVINNLVYVKDWYCYEFAYPFQTEKERDKLLKEYEKKITDSFNSRTMSYEKIDADGTVNSRLYWSKGKKCYADYRYVQSNS